MKAGKILFFLIGLMSCMILTYLATRCIFGNAPDGEFIDNETAINGVIDFLIRINYTQSLLILVPVFLFFFIPFLFAYFLLTRVIKWPENLVSSSKKSPVRKAQ